MLDELSEGEIPISQIDLARKLQFKMLKRWEKLLDDGTLSPTDAATLARLLSQNGWNLDPARIPQRLKDLIGDLPDPKTFTDDDPDVVGSITRIA